MMILPKLALAAVAVAVLEAPIASALSFGAGVQHVLGGSGSEEFNCDLPPVLDPYKDGLKSAEELFDNDEALLKQVQRHGGVVQIPSISYDDNGEPGEDPRWEVFYTLQAKFAELYPAVHRRMGIAKVNTFGLVYTITGENTKLKPLMLTAHQDVVPVADASTWKYPPFSAYFDGQWLWGRGASDDKNSLSALFSALETLLSNEMWHPKRSIILALGFDEECSGRRGAGHIGQYLEELYGKDSMVLLLDEGGMGLETKNNTLYALPATMEKGHVDIWLELHINGGHSSVPFPHTGIGVASEIVTALEANPYEPKLIKGSPIYNHFVCQARYSPDAAPKITELLKKGDLKALTGELANLDRPTRFRLQTSQAVDFFQGGVKINAMPEYIRIGVNHRIAPQNSIPEVKSRLLETIKPVIKKYGLSVSAFKGEESNPEFHLDDLASHFEAIFKDDPAALYNGSLVLKSTQPTLVAPVSPTSGAIWDVFSGTVQHSFRFEGGKVVPVGELMTGNTDTRHYLNLTRNVYRWTPTRKGGNQNAHTVNEGIDMHAHMDALKFYYNLIRNFNSADV